MKIFDINHLPRHGRFDIFAQRDSAQDVDATRAAHVRGTFVVKTCDGERLCKDAYVMVDSAGHPYPVERTTFEAAYKKIPIL